MSEAIPHFITVSADMPGIDNLSFAVLATFVVVSLLAWLGSVDDPGAPNGTGL